MDGGDFGLAVEGRLSRICNAAKLGEEGLEDPGVELFEP